MIISLVSSVIISLALMLLLGFLMTRLTKRLRLPNVTAYIITGIAIGPYCLNLIPQSFIDNSAFLADVALSFIAFSTGEFFRLSTLKKNGMRVVVLTVFESVFASIAVFIVTYFFLGVNLPFALVLSALASATAPASTMMTIRQTGAKGEFVDTLLQVVALDDIVGLVLYSVAISFALALKTGGKVDSISILKPIGVNIAIFALGILFGALMSLMLKKRHSDDSRLIIALSLIFSFTAIASLFDVSPLLGCMAMGTAYSNISEDERLFKQLNSFSPPILQLFFIRSGLAFKLDMLRGGALSVGSTSLLLIGVFYFFSRIAGKYAGSTLGSICIKAKKEIRNYLGLALIPQAGVAIGLAALGSRTLGGEEGLALETVILASSVLYELLGPASAKLSLYLSRSYEKSEVVERVIIEDSDAVALLIERIKEIQKDLEKEAI